MGLAEAAHAGRTLIWGLDHPYLFENTRPMWEGGAASARVASAAVGGLPLECGEWPGQGGGPYACFFQALSSCSLADVSPAELLALGINGFDDGARGADVVLRARRGGCAAAPAPPLFARARRRLHSAQSKFRRSAAAWARTTRRWRRWRR